MLINDRIETTILSNLMFNEPFVRRVLPNIKPEYFEQRTERKIFEYIQAFIHKYNTLPTKEVLLIEVGNDAKVSQADHTDISEIVTNYDTAPTNPPNISWLLDETLAWCQDRALFVALTQAIEIIDGAPGKISKGSIPQLLSDALAVSFDSHVGHDFIEDSSERYDHYHAVEEKVATGLRDLDKVTDGGWSTETLNIFMSGPGGGKTLFMCHLAAASMSAGYDTLYITLEMSKYRIAERIDANLMNIAIRDLKSLPKEMYLKRIERLKQKVKGRLIIKQYPTASASCDNFRHLLDELKMKKNFVPKIIFLDYLNIAASSRYRPGGRSGMYEITKAIAEEVRGLAVEFKLPIISATQVNRAGFKNSDADLEHTSESFGVPATVDFMASIYADENLETLNQMMIKQLKNRYTDPGLQRRIVVGVDKSRMKIYDLDEEAQKSVSEVRDVLDSRTTREEKDEGPVFDNGSFGGGMKAEGSKKPWGKKRYTGIQI